MLTAKSDPLKEIHKIVQLPTAGRGQAAPTVQTARAQSMPPVLFASWVATRDKAAAALLGGSKRLVLTGPPGTGKTVLVEHVARVLRAAGRTVTIQLADADPAPPSAGETLFVDEADRLSAAKLRQLLDAAAGTVVLTGLAPLTRRVGGGTVQLTLEPLGQEQARDYIAQWLALHGRTPAELDSRAVRPLVEMSGGVPRLMSTLLAAGAWLAKSSGATVIAASHIQEAAELRSVLGPSAAPDAAVTMAPPRRGRVVGWALLAAVGLAAVAGFIVPRWFPVETGWVITRARHWVRAGPDTPAMPAPITAALPPIEPASSAEPAPVAEPQAAPEPALPAAELPVPGPSPEPMLAEAVAPAPLVASTVLTHPRALPAATIDLLLRRGHEMLAIDDLSAARLLFRRAAEGGSPEAMFQLGQTYDPAVRTGFGAAGQSDREEALRWYRRAADEGNSAAENLLPRP